MGPVGIQVGPRPAHLKTSMKHPETIGCSDEDAEMLPTKRKTPPAAHGSPSNDGLRTIKVMLVMVMMLLAVCVSLQLVVARDGPKQIVIVQRSPLPHADPSEEDIGRFIASFRAHDPAYQERCVSAMKSGNFSSQHGQDLVIFRNIFIKFAMAGRRGFYIESGANDWSTISNSLFYDKCLGWSGLCIEPQARYHAGYAKRSCTLIPECVADAAKTVGLKGAEGGAEIKEGSGSTRARPLHEMLASVGVTHVDLWVLDVEGYEMTILNSLRWDLMNFTAIMVEDNKENLNRRMLDKLLMDKGFIKYQMLIDSLYLARNDIDYLLRNQWFGLQYPTEWETIPNGIDR